MELEPGREFITHYPGNHLVQRAPCMRPFNSTLFGCSQAPIWYVHLEALNGRASAEVVVDSGLTRGQIVQMASGGMKPPPVGVTPFPAQPPSG